MITTPTVPVVGTSGRAASAAAPAQHIAAPETAQTVETRNPVTEMGRSDRARQYIAERERAMKAKLTAQVVEAAKEEIMAVQPAPEAEGGQKQRVEPIDLLPPPATEVLAKGGKQSRLDARAELFEAEARLRVLKKASDGYEEGRSIIG